MPARVELNITKGDREGESFAYTERELLILGRADDCGIVIAEPTVSRYHCMIEILPPSANFRDFGSGNGIRLNGEMVVPGRFKTGQSLDEAQDSEVTEFALKDGDIIALSSKCEFSVKVFVPEYCAECLVELGEGSENLYHNDGGECICPSCFKQLEEEKAVAQKEDEEKAQAEAERKRLEEEKLLVALKEAAVQKEAEEKAQIVAERKRLEEEKASEQKRLEDEKAAAQKKAEENARLVAEQKRLDKERKKLDEQKKIGAMIQDVMKEKDKCMACGAPLPKNITPNEARLCPKCKADPLVALELLFRLAAAGNAEAAEIKGFRKIRELGRGGMGAVYKVEEEATGSIFALKIMLAAKNLDVMARVKFLREISIATQLDHPHILLHHNYGSSDNTYYVLQEICEGGSVDKLIERRGGKLPVALATDITLQVLDALIYAHSAPIEVALADGSVKKANGVLHRDIKPANYFLMDNSEKPIVKLADFGMAKAFETAGLTDFTRTGDAGGTPVFMPRQQIINFRYAKPDVDVWAVAASYYFMLTGCFPKDFNIKKDPWSQALKYPAVQIRKRDHRIDKRLADVIDQALTEKPGIGYSTAKALKQAIEGAL